MESKPISVLIVDDHPVVREGLRAILSTEPDIHVVGESDTGEAAVGLYLQFRPDLVLMDLLLPDINGTEVIRRICAKSPNAYIVVLTTLIGDEEIRRALEAGARGYLFKDTISNELMEAIRAVHAGRRYIPSPVGSRLAEGFPRPELSPREIEVLKLVASGLKNKEIAFQLTLSEATVNAHVKHILEKLNASDRTHAVTSALKRGVIRL